MKKLINIVILPILAALAILPALSTIAMRSPEFYRNRYYNMPLDVSLSEIEESYEGNGFANKYWDPEFEKFGYISNTDQEPVGLYNLEPEYINESPRLSDQEILEYLNFD